MTITETMLMDWVGQFIWPLVRIAAFIMAAPIFGAQFVPTRVRLMLAVGLTLALSPVLPAMPAFEGLSLAMVAVAAEQVLIGVALGFLAQLLFGLFTLAGQLLAMQMGLGFAQMMDPGSGVSVPIVSQFYLLLVSLLFLAMNGHLVLVDVLAHGFTTLPVAVPGEGSVLFGATMGVPGGIAWQVVLAGAWLFGGAVLVALPGVVALLLVNIAFGMMTRAAPQLNIFSLGFPFSLVFGLLILWASTAGLLPQFEHLSQAFFDLVHRVMLTR